MTTFGVRFCGSVERSPSSRGLGSPVSAGLLRSDDQVHRVRQTQPNRTDETEAAGDPRPIAFH